MGLRGRREREPEGFISSEDANAGVTGEGCDGTLQSERAEGLLNKVVPQVSTCPCNRDKCFLFGNPEAETPFAKQERKGEAE